MTWEEFFTTKFDLLIDLRSSRDNTLHSIGKTVEKSGTLPQTNEAAESSYSELACLVFGLENVESHLTTSGSSGIFTTEKKDSNNHL